MGSSKNKKNEMKNKQNKSKEDISFKDDKDGLHIHITIYNFYNYTNQGGNVETKSYTSEENKIRNEKNESGVNE